jgi:hypothetical protein
VELHDGNDRFVSFHCKPEKLFRFPVIIASLYVRSSLPRFRSRPLMFGSSETVDVDMILFLQVLCRAAPRKFGLYHRQIFTDELQMSRLRPIRVSLAISKRGYFSSWLMSHATRYKFDVSTRRFVALIINTAAYYVIANVFFRQLVAPDNGINFDDLTHVTLLIY